MNTQTEFQEFLRRFVPPTARLYRKLTGAEWELATTGSSEAAEQLSRYRTMYRKRFGDRAKYEQLVGWQGSGKVRDPVLARQLQVLILAFQANMLPPEMLEEMSQREAKLEETYVNFRPKFEGRPASENDIKTILKEETSVSRRQAVWQASKLVGQEMAPGIRELARLRNEGAQRLRFPDYYAMRLELQEIDRDWLLKTLAELARASWEAYDGMLAEVNVQLAQRFGVSESRLGPWAWSEPFCQEDPLAGTELDRLVEKIDVVETAVRFYGSIGMRERVEDILTRSDLYERPKKNQHAFCTDMDRRGDVRVLANVRPTLRWLDTILHELGHGNYDLGINPNLPWLLRSPPHMCSTEAMALIAGRQAWSPAFLRAIVGARDERLMEEARSAQRRRQLIFSRWVLVMVNFEASMYKDPDQDLNALWWSLVKKHQGIQPPAGREGMADWAAKYHIGLAPVYYHSYLMGEMFASQLTESIRKLTGDTVIVGNPEVEEFLQERLFGPGDSMPWHELVKHATSEGLNPVAWAQEFVHL